MEKKDQVMKKELPLQDEVINKVSGGAGENGDVGNAENEVTCPRCGSTKYQQSELWTKNVIGLKMGKCIFHNRKLYSCFMCIHCIP